MSAHQTLEVSGLRAGYVPGVDILSSVSLTAAENAVTLIIGPNGAGKSTLLRAIFGILKPVAGRVLFRGKDVTGANSSTLKAAGLSYVTQDINSFPLLSVEENLLMGAWVFRRDRRRLSRQIESVYAMFPILKEKRRDSAGSLSGGQGRMLSVARELMTQPSLLLIDEPTVGLAPNLVEQVYSLLSAAKTATGAAILLVEQNVEQALPLADHLYLLNLGQVKAQGPGRDFDNSRVRALVQECLLG
ncbi:MAG: ABC transporter ATP-binding protein [Hyphomicrobiaceae bacterium]